MMNMMVTDVGREPASERAGFYITGRFESGFVIGPARAAVKGHPGEVVLRVKQIRADSTGNEVRYDLRQQPRWPAKEINQSSRDSKVKHKGKQAVRVCPGVFDKRSDRHSVKKYDQISKKDGHWMTHE